MIYIDIDIDIEIFGKCWYFDYWYVLSIYIDIYWYILICIINISVYSVLFQSQGWVLSIYQTPLTLICIFCFVLPLTEWLNVEWEQVYLWVAFNDPPLPPRQRNYMEIWLWKFKQKTCFNRWTFCYSVGGVCLWMGRCQELFRCLLPSIQTHYIFCEHAFNFL